MELEEIKNLIAQVNESDLTEFELELGDTNIRMSKNVYTEPVAKMSAEPTNTGVANVNVASAPAAENTVSAVETATQAGTLVKSPIVGVVYLAPSPDKPVFKKIGDAVAEGETVCIVEAMKLMNEIKSEVSGTIAEILVENEQIVEYDQPLFRIV